MGEDFRGWIETAGNFTNIFGEGKVRVRRANGSRGYSVPRMDIHRRSGTQQYWEDLNGAEHDRNYYPAWAYLRKDGGTV